jgi:hypothetical protein
VQVEGELTVASVLDALRAGRSFISTSPAGPQVTLATNGDRLHARVIGAAGATLLVITDARVTAARVDAEDWHTTTGLPSASRYVRAQIQDERGTLLALTNPVWFPAAS